METLTTPGIKVDYAIYPSLLDAFLRYKRRDDDETFISVFDKINKVQSEQTEHQAMGIEFEALVNNVIGQLNQKVHLAIIEEEGFYITNNFKFKCDVVDKIASKLQLATAKQEYMETVIPSHLGNIKLYGIADFSFPEMITDLKTTSSYKCNKYKDNAQHGTYSLIRERNGAPLKAFKYLATDFDKVYQETYIPTEVLHQKLMFTVFEFISFIEYFKNHITDTKIFGGN
ncbi:hypothetical protein [Mucilaginibacter sp. SP1R1]|uniref:hypothetical protein n=1 Tax=Mucilaginibacter sp. SP1R1 TaxID=2723091 RepID=UPI001620E439|nr:hypothetical protein [Mucilaginibacter sp. SP1R1]MBB6152286.1 hypothetical protein [Mucilaginibacter sp. SP1R1]